MQPYRLGPFMVGPNNTGANGVYEGDPIEGLGLLDADSVQLLIIDMRRYGEVQIANAVQVISHVLAPGGSVVVLCEKDQALPGTSKLIMFWQSALSLPINHLLSRRELAATWEHSRWLFKPSAPISTTPTLPELADVEWQADGWIAVTISIPRLIERNTKPGDVVVVAGSCRGIMAVAPLLAGRPYLVFEEAERWLKIARENVQRTEPPLLAWDSPRAWIPSELFSRASAKND